MFSEEIMPLILNVISSWQVIVITLGVILYISLILFVGNTRTQQRNRFHYASVVKKKKPVRSAKSPKKESDEDEEDDINDELGIDEE